MQQCKLHRATCRRFHTIPACDGRTDRWTDRQTDGIAVASTALAMRALRRAVKSRLYFSTLMELHEIYNVNVERTYLIVVSELNLKNSLGDHVR